jgi:hypothetical protein
MLGQIMQKSLAHANFLRFKKMADIEANQEWGKNSVETPFPKVNLVQASIKGRQHFGKKALGLLEALKETLLELKP